MENPLQHFEKIPELLQIFWYIWTFVLVAWFILTIIFLKQPKFIVNVKDMVINMFFLAKFYAAKIENLDIKNMWKELYAAKIENLRVENLFNEIKSKIIERAYLGKNQEDESETGTKKNSQPNDGNPLFRLYPSLKRAIEKFLDYLSKVNPCQSTQLGQFICAIITKLLFFVSKVNPCQSTQLGQFICAIITKLLFFVFYIFYLIWQSIEVIVSGCVKYFLNLIDYIIRLLSIVFLSLLKVIYIYIWLPIIWIGIKKIIWLIYILFILFPRQLIYVCFWQPITTTLLLIKWLCTTILRILYFISNKIIFYVLLPITTKLLQFTKWITYIFLWYINAKNLTVVVKGKEQVGKWIIISLELHNKEGEIIMALNVFVLTQEYNWLYQKPNIVELNGYVEEDFKYKHLSSCGIQARFNDMSDIILVGVASEDEKEERAYERAKQLVVWMREVLIAKPFPNLYTLDFGKFLKCNRKTTHKLVSQRSVIIVGIPKKEKKVSIIGASKTDGHLILKGLLNEALKDKNLLIQGRYSKFDLELVS
jgi:hypothetical protein